MKPRVDRAGSLPGIPCSSIPIEIRLQPKRDRRRIADGRSRSKTSLIQTPSDRALRVFCHGPGAHAAKPGNCRPRMVNGYREQRIRHEGSVFYQCSPERCPFVGRGIHIPQRESSCKTRLFGRGDVDWQPRRLASSRSDTGTRTVEAAPRPHSLPGTLRAGFEWLEGFLGQPTSFK